MIKIFQDREFQSINDRNSGKTFSNLEFRRCHFESCRISTTRNPRRRSTIRNVKIIDCEELGCVLDAAIVEDVLVDGFKTHGLFQIWGAVFKHVIVRGRFGRLMTSPLIATAMGTSAEQNAFNISNTLYYENVDWAFDICEAEFEEADLRGVAAHLVVRDPDTQFILTRERALEGKWKDINLNGTHWKTSIELFLDRGAQDQVFVAPKRNPRYRPLLAGLWALRDAGVVY
jgi:hypothetical protein